MNRRKYSGAFVTAELSLWPEFDCSEVADSARKMLRTRQKALEMYCDEENTVTAIETATGIGRGELIRLFERGMRRDENNIPYGYAALVPYEKIISSTASKMQRLIDMYPGLEEDVRKFYFDSAKEGRPMKHASKRITHDYLLTELRNRGASLEEYPFTLQDKGRRATEKWLDEIEIKRKLFMSRQTQDAKTEHRSSGHYIQVSMPTRPLQAIQIDGHRLDFLYVVPVRYITGEPGYKVVCRPWLITAIDVATRCVVGYTIAFDEEYSSDDVLKVIENITAPHIPHPKSRPDTMPSQVFEELRYAIPSVIFFDNALQHYAIRLQKLKYVFGYTFCYGPAGLPTGRPHVERYFNTFEKKWGHAIPSTTGSDKDDPVRIKAEQDAIAFGFTRDMVDELIAISVGEYNNSLHTGINMTPMGKMRELLSLGILPARLEPSRRDTFRLWDTGEAKIRGSKTSGRRPYIQINKYRYTGECISNSYNLIGQIITLHIFPDNVLVIQAYYKGRYLGPLYLKDYRVMQDGRLSRRQALKARKYLNSHNITSTHGLDDVSKYILELRKDANKKNVKDLANIYYDLAEIGATLDTSILAPEVLPPAEVTDDSALAKNEDIPGIAYLPEKVSESLFEPAKEEESEVSDDVLKLRAKYSNY